MSHEHVGRLARWGWVVPLLVACESNVDLGTEWVPPVGDGSARDAPDIREAGAAIGLGSDGQVATVSNEADAPWDAPRACDGMATGEETYSSVSALEQLVVGTWTLCVRPSLFNTTDEAGMTIDPDGSWHKLLLVGDKLVRADSPEKTGTWRILVTVAGGSAPYQVRFDAVSGASVAVVPHFALIPHKMIVQHDGDLTAEYLRN